MRQSARARRPRDYCNPAPRHTQPRVCTTPAPLRAAPQRCRKRPPPRLVSYPPPSSLPLPLVAPQTAWPWSHHVRSSPDTQGLRPGKASSSPRTGLRMVCAFFARNATCAAPRRLHRDAPFCPLQAPRSRGERGAGRHAPRRRRTSLCHHHHLTATHQKRKNKHRRRMPLTPAKRARSSRGAQAPSAPQKGHATLRRGKTQNAPVAWRANVPPGPCAYASAAGHQPPPLHILAPHALLRAVPPRNALRQATPCVLCVGGEEARHASGRAPPLQTDTGGGLVQHAGSLGRTTPPEHNLKERSRSLAG